MYHRELFNSPKKKQCPKVNCLKRKLIYVQNVHDFYSKSMIIHGIINIGNDLFQTVSMRQKRFHMRTVTRKK